MLFSRSENSEFKERRRRSRPIAEHPYFVPSLMLWGAALAGLSVMVLPASLINQVTTIAALGALGEFARLFYAVLAAGFGAGCGFFAATKWRDSLPVRSQAMMNRRAGDLRPIDPAQDLGSESLDAPLDEESTSEVVTVEEDEVEEHEEDILDLTVECEAEADEIQSEDSDVFDLTSICEAEADASCSDDDVLVLGADCEANPEPDQEPAPATEGETEPEPIARDPLKDEHCEPAPEHVEPASLLSIPRRRNRGETVELVQALGNHRARHAARHKDQLGPRGATQSPCKEQAEFTHTPTAVEKLRAVPPHELSLVQLVERLAVALHERRDLARNRPQSEQATERDVALADALKALAIFTAQDVKAPIKAETPAENDTESELREALSKLQTLQGAA